MSRKKSDLQPNWRPDFRDLEALPDIKVVRTDFIVNFFAVTIMLLVAFIVLQREYRSYSLRQSIKGLEAEINDSLARNESHLRLDKRFRSASERIVELEKFFAGPIMAHDFLIELDSLRPNDLIFSTFAYREIPPPAKSKAGPSYTFTFKGDVKTLTGLSNFKESLLSSSFSMPTYDRNVSESTSAPDAVTGIFPYSVEMKLVPETPKKAPAQKEGTS